MEKWQKGSQVSDTPCSNNILIFLHFFKISYLRISIFGFHNLYKTVFILNKYIFPISWNIFTCFWNHLYQTFTEFFGHPSLTQGDTYNCYLIIRHFSTQCNYQRYMCPWNNWYIVNCAQSVFCFIFLFLLDKWMLDSRVHRAEVKR